MAAALKKFFKRFPWAAPVIAFALVLAQVYLTAWLQKVGAIPAGFWTETVARVILAVPLALVILLLSGKRPFKLKKGDVGYTFRYTLLVLLPLVAIIGILMLSTVSKGIPTPDVSKLLSIVTLCAMVGIVEEMFFRVIVHDGLFFTFRSRKKVFLAVMLADAFLFGFVHVMSSIPTAFQDPGSTLTFFLKIIESGLFAIIMLILYWRRESVWGIAIVHALNDLIPLAGVYIGTGNSDLMGYVNAGAAGYANSLVYVVMIVLHILALLVLKKKVVPTIDFQKIREDW